VFNFKNEQKNEGMKTAEIDSSEEVIQFVLPQIHPVTQFEFFSSKKGYLPICKNEEKKMIESMHRSKENMQQYLKKHNMQKSKKISLLQKYFSKFFGE